MECPGPVASTFQSYSDRNASNAAVISTPVLKSPRHRGASRSSDRISMQYSRYTSPGCRSAVGADADRHLARLPSPCAGRRVALKRPLQLDESSPRATTYPARRPVLRRRPRRSAPVPLRRLRPRSRRSATMPRLVAIRHERSDTASLPRPTGFPQIRSSPAQAQPAGALPGQRSPAIVSQSAHIVSRTRSQSPKKIDLPSLTRRAPRSEPLHLHRISRRQGQDEALSERPSPRDLLSYSLRTSGPSPAWSEVSPHRPIREIRASLSFQSLPRLRGFVC